MADVFSHPYLSDLFADSNAEVIWSPERQLSHMLAFEAAYARALGAVGRVSAGSAEGAATRIEAFQPDIAEIRAATARDGVPVPVLVTQLKQAAGPYSEAVHSGATSQDVVDTALSLTLKENTALLLEYLGKLSKCLIDLHDRFGARSLMGRTRMQAALPIDVAHRIDAWRRPLLQHMSRLEQLRTSTERVQLGGAVGDRKQLGENGAEVAHHMAQALELSPSPDVWHTDRSGVADYASVLSLISGTLGKMGQDICLMAQQEPRDIEISGSGGSSAMPHKQNPVLAELLVTLARFNASQLSGMHHALIHEQERSGSAWALEWMLLPQMARATARALTAALTLCNSVQKIGQDHSPDQSDQTSG